MKRLIIILLLALLVVAIPMPVMAQSFPYPDGTSTSNITLYSQDLETIALIPGKLDNLNSAIIGIAWLIVLAVISGWAFWKENAVLFLISFGTAWMIGLNAPDLIDGNTVTSTLGLSLGVMLLFYGMFCAGMSFRLMFWQSREE